MTSVDEAKDLVENKLEKKSDGKTPKITTSQLRKFLSAVNSVTNKVQICKEQVLPADLINEIQYLRVKLAYQAGRYDDVRKFALASGLDNKIKGIKTKKDYLDFARYMESIIAFHKFNKGE
jgi:CRISPR-associated protein Csm2